MVDPEVRGELAEELALLSGLVQDVLDADATAEEAHDSKMFVRRPGEVGTVDDDIMDIDYMPSDANSKAMWARNMNRELVDRSFACHRHTC